MTYPTIDQVNITGLDGFFTYSAQTVPIFPALILFAFFFITTMATFFAMRRDLGQADAAQAAMVGSFLTMVIAVVMTLIGKIANYPLISTPVLVTTFAMAIASFIWLKLSEEN